MSRTHRTLAALLLAAIPAAAQADTLIDSYTQSLPPNNWLQNTHRPILFIGSVCDGDLCPPSPMVTFPDDQTFVDQSGVTGTISPWRITGLARTHRTGPPDQGVLRIDPANGGNLVFEGAAGADLTIVQYWGEPAHPLGLDLTADGSDHFEIEVLDWPVGLDTIHGAISLSGSSGAVSATAPIFGHGPGTRSIPYEWFAPLDLHDIDFIQAVFYITPETPPTLVVGEFRMAGTPIPAAPQTWGRIKNAYRN